MSGDRNPSWMRNPKVEGTEVGCKARDAEDATPRWETDLLAGGEDPEQPGAELGKGGSSMGAPRWTGPGRGAEGVGL